MKKLVLLFFTVITVSFSLQLNAQSCFNVSAGPDISTSCLNTCFNFTAKIPDVRTTEDYKVVPIPYNPYPFITPGGNEFNEVYIDDKFSKKLILPFSFCFYGNIFTEITAGSNGVLSFDTKTNEDTDEGYVIEPGDTIPMAVGFPNNISVYYPPASSIFLAYYDLDPRLSASPKRKIEWRLEGTAPCRKLIISYYMLDFYEESACNGRNLLCTMQAVLYEGTGIIDVFYESKPICTDYQDGLAIAGIQNAGRDKAVVIPGRNGTVWSASNEGWRYIPNGTTSLLNRVELYKNNIKVADGVTSNTGTGELEVDFGSICQSEDMATYVVRAFYKKCDDPTQETEGSDTMVVFKEFKPVLADIVAPSCPTATNGTLTITDPVDPTVEYSIDGGANWQTSPVFSNLSGGSYTVIAKIIGNTCKGNGTFIVTPDPNPTVNRSITEPNCPGSATGSITVTAPVGATVEYSIDGGVNWQASPTFSGLADGSYTITARINPSGCTGTTTATLTDPPPMAISLGKTDVLCNSTATGTVTVSSPTGADYEYSIDGGSTWQSSPTFNVPAGSYTVTVRQISINCTNTQTINVAEPTLLSATSAETVQATCANDNGELTVTATGGVSPYTYSINGGTAYQPSAVFTGLTVGTYNQIMVKDANGCTFSSNPVTIVLNDTMRLELGADTSLCAGTPITLLPQTNDAADIFTWSPSTGLSSTVVKNPEANPTDTIKYYLTARWGLCERKDSIVVNVKHKPVVFAGLDTAICSGTKALLHGSVSNLSGTVNYAWAPAESLDDATALTTIASPAATTTYMLSVTDNYSCNFTVTDVIRVTVNPPVVAFAGNDTNAILNRPHQLMASGGVSYTWTPSAPLDNPFSPRPLAVLQHDTYFTVTVKDNIGCEDTDDVFIKVYEGPNYYLPNAFSPNGDGLNDVFRPVPVGISSTQYFRVFNRLGQLIFETKEWMKGWDGTYQGKKQLPGTYVWTIKGIDKNGRVVEMQGTVILIQ